jgi:multiple sugar transport system permease protein
MKWRPWSNPRERKITLVALAFLAPNVIGFLIFTAGPVLLSLFMSFTNWSLKPAVELQWVGWRNYLDLFGDPQFWFYLYNTLYFMLGIPISVAGSLFLANLLADPMRIRGRYRRFILAAAVLVTGLFSCGALFMWGQKDAALLLGVLYAAAFFALLFGSVSFRTMLYVPHFAAGVATIVLWTQIYNPHYGLANNMITSVAGWFNLDIEAPTWLISTRSLLGFIPFPEHFSSGGFGLGAREAIMIMSIWMAVGGNNMIMYLASISNIPTDLFEAAEVDGAGAVGKFLHITMPQVAPTTFFIVTMAIIGGLQGGFEFARVMTQGGPAGSTTTLSYYIYTTGFEELNFGYASAVSWVMFVMVFVMTMINWRYGNRGAEG